LHRKPALLANEKRRTRFTRRHRAAICFPLAMRHFPFAVEILLSTSIYDRALNGDTHRLEISRKETISTVKSILKMKTQPVRKTRYRNFIPTQFYTFFIFLQAIILDYKNYMILRSGDIMET